MTERVLILDFGSQYTQLIARRVRETGVYCEILPCTADDAASRRSRRRRSSSPAGRPRPPRRQRRAHPARCSSWACRSSASATASRPSAPSSAARSRSAITASSAARSSTCAAARCSRACSSRAARDQVWMSHGDKIVELPPGFRVVARSIPRRSPRSPTTTRRIYGVQFHPEVVHTPRAAMLPELPPPHRGCRGDWSMAASARRSIAHPRAGRRGPRDLRPLGRGRFRGAALLLHEAIGDQLTCVFVDTACSAPARPSRWSSCFAATSTSRWSVDAAASSSSASPASPTPSQAQDHRQHLHRRLRARGEARWAEPISSPRARSTPT